MCTQAHAYNLSYGKYYEGKVKGQRKFFWESIFELNPNG